MEKSSLGKILLALSVLSLYVFLFGIMDVIEPVSARVDRAAETSESEPSSKGAEETDEPAETPAFTIDTANRRKPGLADYGVPVLPVTPEPFSEVTEPLPETSGETETPAATPEETPLIIDEPDEPDETRTETAKTEEGTSAPETSAPVEPPASEKLSVISGGEIVEGDANDIVSRIVQNEIGSSFNREAIKAQAVAAYTYIKRQNALSATPTFILASAASDKVKECVNEVAGKGIYYNGELIQSVFCASTAGYSSSSVNVWGEDFPYLRSVKCVFDEQYDPNYGLTKVFTSNEVMLKVLKETGIELSGDPAGWFKILSWVDTVYVGELSIGGKTSYTNGGNEIKITGRVFREKIMGISELRSAAFTVSYDNNRDTFTFTTYGYGHGAGMSQNGANILANNQGYGYVDILKHYYIGVEVK